MGSSKFLLVALLVAFLCFHLAESEALEAGVGRSLLPKIDCKGACAGRCRLASRNKICMRACGTCCYRCNCVPPGTSGNRDACPCYARMTTHGGRLKCP